MEDGKHVGSAFCAPGDMTIQPPGRLQHGGLQRTPAGHVIDIQIHAFQALIRLFFSPGQPEFEAVKHELDLSPCFAGGGGTVEE